MDVDFAAYRCRLRQLGSRHGTKVAPSLFKKQHGCVSFIDTLLLMAGIEPNPGPGMFIVNGYN